MNPTVSPSPDPQVFGIGTNTWDVIGTIFQILAIIVGGIWAYRAFIRKREEYPSATVKQSISHLILPDKRVLLRAQIEVTNSGMVLIRLEEGIFRVDRVLPLADGMHDVVALQESPSDGDLAINWPPIENRPYKWGTPLEIEPEEAEVVVCDFILPPGLQTVQVYTWFKNVSKEGEIGWAASSFYDLPDGRVGESATREFRPVTGSQERRA